MVPSITPSVWSVRTTVAVVEESRLYWKVPWLLATPLPPIRRYWPLSVLRASWKVPVLEKVVQAAAVMVTLAVSPAMDVGGSVTSVMVTVAVFLELV